MKRFPVLTVSLLALTALSACTPVARGSQADYPIEEPDAQTPVPVMPGQTVFVTVPYSRAAIEDDNEYDAYFDAISFDYSAVRSSGDKVPDAYRDAAWLTLKSVDAPAGIGVTLTKANIGRIVNQTKLSGTSVNVKYGERFRLQFKVSVAADYKAPSADTAAGIKSSLMLTLLSPETRAAVKAMPNEFVPVKLTLADGTNATKTTYLLLNTSATK